jgi:nucleotide-binding universal stress UspA family protein
VVVGVDGSPDGTAALDAAFRQAAASGCPVQAVRAFPCAMPSFAGIAPSLLWPEESVSVESKALTRLLEPYLRRYPEVPVEELVDPGDAADALVRASRHARLVVVGNRGSGPHTSPLPGSATLNLLHHADCPVMIVRSIRTGPQLVGATSAARRPPVDG